MDDDYSSDNDKPRTIKIIPRNLTAFAAYPVPGNPAISRPESGVEVSFPGLEMDQRALEQRFFPGLYFEFQREDGAILADVDLRPNQLASGLSKSDLSPLRPLFLLGIYYKVNPKDEKPTFFSFQRLRGQDVGPRIRDLPRDRVAIIFGPDWQTAMADSFSRLRLDERLNQLECAFKAKDDAEKFKVFRDNNGQLACGIFSDDRTVYLNEYGVIDPAVFPPGDLTKSLCAPWIHDFRDCLCFYWASNKPDITDDTEPPFLNYLRDRQVKPPPPPTANYHEWTRQRISQGVLLSGEWRNLPIVLNDREEPKVLPVEREVEDSKRSPFADLNPKFDRDDIINELKYLATVEHALVAEYLFGHYTLNAPQAVQEDEKLDDDKKIVFGVAADLLTIAIDEMRHFLWVNQVLRLLDCKEPITDRADVIGLHPKDDHLFKRKALPGFTYLERKVSLRRLDFDVLDEFIKIETNSRKVERGRIAFGMYIQLLAGIRNGAAKPTDPAAEDNTEDVVKLVKLLIDEGDEHGVLFQSMKKRLETVRPSYLRKFDPEPDGDDIESKRIKNQLDLGDAYYHTLLAFIHVSYALRERAGGELIRTAVSQMHLLHSLGHDLARQNFGLRLTKPERSNFRVPVDTEDALELLKEYEEDLKEKLKKVEDTGDEQSRKLVVSQRNASTRIYEKMRRTIQANE